MYFSIPKSEKKADFLIGWKGTGIETIFGHNKSL